MLKQREELNYEHKMKKIMSETRALTLRGQGDKTVDTKRPRPPSKEHMLITQKFLELGQNFDTAQDLIEETNDMLDEGILDVYDRTLVSLEKWGVSVDKK